MESVFARIAPILNQLKERKIEAGLLGAALVTCIIGAALLVFSFSFPQSQAIKTYSEAPYKKDADTAAANDTGFETVDTGAGGIVVDIAGAINRPGVYRLPTNARLNDVVQKANGLSEQANTTFISRSLNLAEVLRDQQKIYIPSLTDEADVLSSVAPPSAIVQNTTDGLSQGPLLNINSASKDELETLPGIGQITAEKIIEGRPYSSIEELSKNGVLKKNIFEGIKEKIST